jgi:hypothetical protein
VHLHSNIKWYQERWLHGTRNQGHTVCGRFTKFAVLSPLEHATISQHCRYYQASAWSISANTRATPEVTNTELANGRSTKSQCGTFGHPENSYWDTVTFLLKTGRMGTVLSRQRVKHRVSSDCATLCIESNDFQVTSAPFDMLR